jgi:hypothetical protein
MVWTVKVIINSLCWPLGAFNVAACKLTTDTCDRDDNAGS